MLSGSRTTVQIIGICLNNAGMLVLVGISMTTVEDADNILIDMGVIKPDNWTSIQPLFTALLLVLGFNTLALSLSRRLAATEAVSKL